MPKCCFGTRGAERDESTSRVVECTPRGIAAAPVPGGTAVAPRAQPKTKEEKAAQRAADANVDASLQQYMAQREAKKAAAGGGRKPVSDRLKKLRERAG